MIRGGRQAGPLRNRVVEWLVDEGLEVSTSEVPQGAPIEWAIKATMKAPIRVSIILQQPKGKGERVDVVLGVAISEFHKRKLRDLDSARRARMMNDLIVKIICACPDCLVAVQPRIDDPHGILVSKTLQGSKVTRENLAEMIRVMANIYLLIVAMFNSELGSPVREGPKKGGDYYSSI